MAQGQGVMRSKGFAVFALLILPLGLLSSGVRAQAPMERMANRGRVFRPRLEIRPPANLVADRGVTIEWTYTAEPIDPQTIPSLTWYYTSAVNGIDRRRVVTLFHESFTGDLLQRWLPVNALRDDWEVRLDGGKRGDRFVRMRPGGEPILSLDHFANEFVVSARLRPLGANPDYGISVRANREAREFYALRGAAELLNPENPTFNHQQPLAEVLPGKWYWYELGVRNRGKRDVVVRARIWDAEHQTLLASFNTVDPGGPPCPQGQRIGLLPGADYSEVHVDPWSSRWLTPGGSFTWDTRDVPNGDYFLTAVIDDGNGLKPRWKKSDFSITVKH